MDLPAQTILVVDDQPINVRLLQRRFERDDMNVLTASNGVECLNTVEEHKPDIILLDVMMPEMDGIETCRRLKQNPETRDIPVIFITARNSKEGKIKGLRLGAADYITKPIDLEETAARVQTQLNIQLAYRENLELQQRLNDLRRSAAIGSISQGVSHNLNNLLGVVVGYVDLLKKSSDNPEFVLRSVNAMESAINRIVSLIRKLSKVASQEYAPITDCSLSSLINTAMERAASGRKVEYDIEVISSLTEPFTFKTNPEAFETILINFLYNAMDAVEGISGKPKVSIAVDQIGISTQDYVRIKVSDNGSGIDEKIRDTLFEPFVTTQTEVGRGLGLALSHHAARLLGGEVSVASNTEGPGAASTLLIPLEPASDKGAALTDEKN